MKKIRRFFDTLIDLLEKPLAFIDTKITREPENPLEGALCIFWFLVGVPFMVILGAISFVFAVIRDIICGMEA